MKYMTERLTQSLKSPAKAKAELESHILDSIKGADIKQELLREYGALADTAHDLIKLLREENFQDSLAPAQADAYRELMARFSHCGRRASRLINRSTESERDAALAMAPSPSRTLN